MTRANRRRPPIIGIKLVGAFNTVLAALPPLLERGRVDLCHPAGPRRSTTTSAGGPTAAAVNVELSEVLH